MKKPKKKLKKSSSRSKYQTIGIIAVDTGCIRIADPCNLPEEEDWIGFNDTLRISSKGESQSVSIGEHQDFSSAVYVQTGLGDGAYPVEIKRCQITGRIKEVRIKFF